MKRIKLYIAISLDGYIATPDGGVEWLDKYQSDTEDNATLYIPPAFRHRHPSVPKQQS